jgi:hypothetical protein
MPDLEEDGPNKNAGGGSPEGFTKGDRRYTTALLSPYCKYVCHHREIGEGRWRLSNGTDEALDGADQSASAPIQTQIENPEREFSTKNVQGRQSM